MQQPSHPAEYRKRRELRLLPGLLIWLSLLFGATPSWAWPAQTGSATHNACDMCAGTRTIACLTCKGTLIEDLPCASCDARGRYDCADCVKGRADCSNSNCKDGEVTWRRASGAYGTWNLKRAKKDLDRDDCKLCRKKGTISCAQCSSGIHKCGTCRGKGSLRAACGDCVGAGQMPCPLCSVKTDRSRCPWSGIRKTRDCLACIKPPAKRNCETCEGAGHSTCERCKGLAKIHCGRCGGSGKMRTVLVFLDTPGTTGRGGVKKHADCKGKGIEACPSCKRGRLDCKECDKGKVSSCIHCAGTKRARCRGCNDQPYHPFEVYAEHLRKEKHHERSLEFLKTASERLLKVHAELDLALKKQVDRYLELEEKSNARATSTRKSTYYKKPLKELDAQRLKLRVRERAVGKRIKAAIKRVRAELAEELSTDDG